MKTTHESALQLAFREIARTGEASLAALASALRLKRSTLEEKIRALRQKGLVSFEDGGRKAALDPRFGHVVGIDMGASNLRFALADFRGELLTRVSERLRPEDGPK